MQFNSKNCRLFVFMGLLLSGTLSFAQEIPELTTLEDLVGQWVGLRSLIAAEQQDWHRQDQQWQREIALLQEEERRLDDKIAQATQSEAAKESRTSDQLSQKANLEAALSALSDVIDRASAELTELLPSIPESLQSLDFVRLLNALNSSHGERSPARQFQQLVSAITEIELIQNQTHTTRELLDFGSDMRREMDVVYIGLSQGYAVSPDNAIAATGTPSHGGWQWNVNPEIATDVRKLVRIQNKEQPPELVTVPIEISAGEGQP